MTNIQAFPLFIGIFASSFLVMIGVYIFQRRKVTARLERSVLGRKPSALGADGVSNQIKTVWRTNYILNAIKAFSERVDVLKGNDPEALSMTLATSGYVGREPMVIYAFSKLMALLFGVMIFLVVTLNALLTDEEVLMPIAISLGIALMLLRAPDVFLSLRRKDRQSQIKRNFPQMIELMIIASEAGLAPSPAMLKTADEMSKNSPALSGELRQLVTELSVLSDRSEGYQRFAKRIGLPEANHFGTALLQGEAFGTSFASTLKTMARELRTMRMTKIEERATRLPVMMTVPLIVFVMPALFVVILGPAALSIVDNIGSIHGEP